MIFVAAMGALSAFLAVIQVVSDPQGPLYFYRITNNGAAVGLFANRNHQALLLAAAFPLLGLIVAGEGQDSFRKHRNIIWLVGLMAVLFLVASLLVNGSRSGLVMASTSALLTGLIGWWGRRLHADRNRWRTLRGALPWTVGPTAIIALVAAAYAMDRAEVFERFVHADIDREARLAILPTVIDMVRTFTPWGSGIGSFQQVYQIYEADDLLSPIYMNHAHNDWLEIAVTGGVPALVLALALAGIVVCQGLTAILQRSQNFRLAGTGLILVLLCAMGSLSDYPLRVPSITALMMLSLVCLRTGDSRSGASSGDEQKGGTDTE